MGVDDECSDFGYEWIERLWNTAVWKMKNDYDVDALFDNIPEDMLYSWHDKFWYFDTAKWTTKIDNRSLPNTRYNSMVRCIFEFNSYEIVDDMIKYIKKTCRKLKNKKRDVDLMVDTSAIKSNVNIPALEISIHQTNERINKLEKLINERMDELELFVSANLTKHEDIINELTQKNNDSE